MDEKSIPIINRRNENNERTLEMSTASILPTSSSAVPVTIHQEIKDRSFRRASASAFPQVRDAEILDGVKIVDIRVSVDPILNIFCRMEFEEGKIFRYSMFELLSRIVF